MVSAWARKVTHALHPPCPSARRLSSTHVSIISSEGLGPGFSLGIRDVPQGRPHVSASLLLHLIPTRSEPVEQCLTQCCPRGTGGGPGVGPEVMGGMGRLRPGRRGCLTKQRLGTNLRTLMGGPAGGGRERPRGSRAGGPWRCSCLCLSGPLCQPPYWVCVSEVPRCCPYQVVGVQIWVQVPGPRVSISF